MLCEFVSLSSATSVPHLKQWSLTPSLKQTSMASTGLNAVLLPKMLGHSHFQGEENFLL
jgi:hypothetical protein